MNIAMESVEARRNTMSVSVGREIREARAACWWAVAGGASGRAVHAKHKAHSEALPGKTTTPAKAPSTSFQGLELVKASLLCTLLLSRPVPTVVGRGRIIYHFVRKRTRPASIPPVTRQRSTDCGTERPLQETCAAPSAVTQLVRPLFFFWVFRVEKGLQGGREDSL